MRNGLRLLFGFLLGAVLVSGAAYLVLRGVDSVLSRVAAAVAALLALSAAVTGAVKSVRPDPDARRAQNRRRNFAEHVVLSLKLLADSESWDDDRYTELEGEVEMEGLQRGRFLRWRASRSLRRVKSLSIALEFSTEPVILLEGEPGAGKSVALRHVAHRMATAIAGKPGTRSPTPLYINLKSFRAEYPIRASDIRKYVLDSLNPRGSDDVDHFLEAEFDEGVRTGRWFFLFDSFDEIPDILSSTEADAAVEEHAAALKEFFNPFNKCRGVLASREFRGPRRLGWPRFRVVRLSHSRQYDLVRRWNMSKEVEAALLLGLEAADAEMRKLAETPLFLGLLSSYMRTGGAFPNNSFAVFEQYVGGRVERNRKRIDPGEVHAAAEEIAFGMASVRGFGLEVEVDTLTAHLVREKNWSEDRADAAVRALVYVKLARLTDGGRGRTRFTFLHRRLQEYYATRVVLREPDRVSLVDLVCDQNWRETAVTVLQTQAPERRQPLLDAAIEEMERRFAAQGRHRKEII